MKLLNDKSEVRANDPNKLIHYKKYNKKRAILSLTFLMHRNF